MCPTYKATGREHASPRAKANLLRSLISDTLPRGPRADRLIKRVTDYCIGCGMCAVECPSKVDIPKLVLEAKSRYRRRHRASRVDFAMSRRLMARSRRAGRRHPLANRLLDLAAVRLAARHPTGHRPTEGP